MARNVHVELILLFLICHCPERITTYRPYQHRYPYGYFSSEESMEMSSESFEGDYYGHFRRTLPHQFDYELFADYTIVREDSLRPLDHFGGHSFFWRAMRRSFGTFAGKKYFITQDNRSFHSGSAVSLDGILISENRLQRLYGFGRAPRHLPLLYVGRRGYENVFLIGKSDLDALTGGLASATIATKLGITTSAPQRTMTVPSRDGGIPGRDASRSSRFSRG